MVVIFSAALAAIDWDSLINDTAPNLGSGSTIGDLIGGKGHFPGLSLFIFFISGLALLLYLLFGGFKLLTSGSNSKSVEEGKQIITNALVGFLIVFTAYWIVQIIGLFLGLEGFGGVF
jgi:hypothetical protein